MSEGEGYIPSSVGPPGSPLSVMEAERSENDALPGRLTADQQEVEVGESVTLSWDLKDHGDCVDRIGVFPAGEDIIGMVDYIDLKFEGLNHSHDGSVTWVVEESLFPYTETFAVFRLYTFSHGSSRVVAKSQPLRVKNSNGLEAAVESQQADVTVDPSLTNDAPVSTTIRDSLSPEPPDVAPAGPPAVEGSSDSDADSTGGAVPIGLVDNEYSDIEDAIQNHKPDTMVSLDTGKRHQLIRATLSGMALRRSVSHMGSQQGTAPTTPDTPLTTDDAPFTLDATPLSPSATPLLPTDPTEVSKDGSGSESGRRQCMCDILRTDSLDPPPHSALQRQTSCPPEETYASFSRRAQERQLLMTSLYMKTPPTADLQGDRAKVGELPTDGDRVVEIPTNSNSHRIGSEETARGRPNNYVDIPSNTHTHGHWRPGERSLTMDGNDVSGTHVQSTRAGERERQMGGDKTNALTATRRAQLEHLLSMRYTRPRVSSTEARSPTSSSTGTVQRVSSTMADSSSDRCAPVLPLEATKNDPSTDPNGKGCENDTLLTGSSKDVLEAETSSEQPVHVAPTLETCKDTPEMDLADVPTSSVDPACSVGDTVPVSIAANGSGASPRLETAEPRTLSGETPEGVESATPPAGPVVDEDLQVTMAMPAYKFITRPDLYSYLREDAPGSAGVDLLQNMEVLKMIQQIRADPTAFKACSKKKRLVAELNKFAMKDCELPVGWAARTDKRGRIFYMDHNTRCTTFIDPRLPYPGHTIAPKSTKPTGLRISVVESSVISTTSTGVSRVSTSAGASRSSSSSLSRLSLQHLQQEDAIERCFDPVYQTRVQAFLSREDIYEVIATRYDGVIHSDIRMMIDIIRTSGGHLLMQSDWLPAMVEVIAILSLFDDIILSEGVAHTLTPPPLPTADSATLPSARAVKSFFSRPDMLSYVQRYTTVTPSVRRIVFNIQTRSARAVEQDLAEDREVRELVLLFRDHIDDPPHTDHLSARPRCPTPPPRPDADEHPSDYTIDEVVLFFTQENIYSILLQKQSVVTLSTRAIVETIRNNGVDGVYRLMAEGNEVFELLEVFKADILRHGVELGLREVPVAGRRGQVEQSRQESLLPRPARPTLRDGAAAMMEADSEPSIDDVVSFFKDMTSDELLDKLEFLSEYERAILAEIQSIDNPVESLAHLRYREPAVDALLAVFESDIQEYMRANPATQPRPSTSTGSPQAPALRSTVQILLTPAVETEVAMAMPVAVTPSGPRGTAEEKLQFSGQLGTMQAKLRFKIPPCPLYDFNSMIIRRHRLLIDAYENIMGLPPKELKFRNIHIEFEGEPGIDYGGPGREFFFCVSHELFNPYYGLFEYSSAGSYTIQISPFSSSIKDSLQWFWFAGRFIGLAIIKNYLVDVFFARHIYKLLLGRTLELADLETVDPAFHNSLKYIRDNDPEDVGGLTFSVTEESFGEVVVKNLKSRGHRIPVTNGNKMEYIDLMVNWRLRVSTAAQSDALVKGFREIVPLSCIDHFKASELEWVIAGTPFIDINDWKANTMYNGGYSADHRVIGWFWKAVEEYSNEQRLKLLQFVTGTSSIPFEGFKALQGFGELQMFSIYNHGDPKGCPVAHTCFNRLDLPEYRCCSDLTKKLTLAIEGTEGFGVV